MSDSDPVRIGIVRFLGLMRNVPQINALRGVPMSDVTGEAAQVAIARVSVEGGRRVAHVDEKKGERLHGDSSKVYGAAQLLVSTTH